MKKITKKIIMILLIIVVVMFLLVAHLNHEYFFVNDFYETNKTIGVIDGGLSFDNENIVITNIDYTFCGEQKKHGDYLLDFIEKVSDVSIAYFDACDEFGKINTERIITGLEWMKENDIKYVNISLSGNRYSEELENWLEDNPDIHVYASYNNNKNSFDYPAMYDGVIGSSVDEELVKSEKDRVYSSNKIVLDYDFKNIYEGNSFLSVLSLMSDLED